MSPGPLVSDRNAWIIGSLAAGGKGDGLRGYRCVSWLEPVERKSPLYRKD